MQMTFWWFSRAYLEGSWQRNLSWSIIHQRTLRLMSAWAHTHMSTALICSCKHNKHWSFLLLKPLHCSICIYIHRDRDLFVCVCSDQVAFITGGGSGIGFRIAEVLMRWVVSDFSTVASRCQHFVHDWTSQFDFFTHKLPFIVTYTLIFNLWSCGLLKPASSN